MAKLLKLRRGTTTQHASFTGAEGEVTVDITKDTAVVHDGSQAGGTPLAKEDMSNVSSSSIAGQLGANSIDVSKVSGLALDKIYEGDSKVEVVDSGTGYVSTEVDGTEIQRHAGGASTINYLRVGANWNMADPSASGSAGIAIGDAGNSHDFIAGSQTNGLAIQSNYGIEIKQNGFPNQVYAGFNTAGCNFFVGGNVKLLVHSTGVTTHLPILPNVDSNTDLGSSSLRWQNIYTDAADVAGNITVSGTVDGRDVAADGTKLDTYEANGSSYVRSDASDTLTGNYTFSNSSDEKIILQGSNNPYIRFRSGTTNKAYVQWDNSNGEFLLVNEESSDFVRIGSGLTGLKYQADGVNATVWTSGNDGTGSGLDADLLDGKHDTSFLRSDAGGGAASYEADLDITFKGGAGAVTVDSGSDIRIAGGTWTGEYASGIKIQADGSNSYFQYHGNLYFRRGSDGSNRLNVDSTGNVTASGNVTAYSDAKLKTNVNTINEALSIVGKLRGVSFDWKETGERSIGVIAQEVEEVLPELVLTNQDVNPVTQEIEEIKSVDYGKIVGVLINAINELKEEVEELKNAKIT